MFEARGWQGPPHINKVTQYKLCGYLRSVCLLNIFGHENKEFAHLVLIGLKNKKSIKILKMIP